MKTRIVLGLAVCLSVSLAVGCQNPRGIVRGQAPNQAMTEAQFAPTDQGVMNHGGQQPQGGFRGGHYHTFEYRAPEGMTYPPANQPPAVVQYPYYTLRGPTDFFQK